MRTPAPGRPEHADPLALPRLAAASPTAVVIRERSEYAAMAMGGQAHGAAPCGPQPCVRVHVIGPRWHPLPNRLHAQLSMAVPGYQLTDVAEKLGGLRIQVTTGGQVAAEGVSALVAAAAAEAAVTCEFCGAAGRPRSRSDVPGGWIKTVCDSCRTDWSAHKILIVHGAMLRRSR